MTDFVDLAWIFLGFARGWLAGIEELYPGRNGSLCFFIRGGNRYVGRFGNSTCFTQRTPLSTVGLESAGVGWPNKLLIQGVHYLHITKISVNFPRCERKFVFLLLKLCTTSIGGAQNLDTNQPFRKTRPRFTFWIVAESQHPDNRLTI